MKKRPARQFAFSVLCIGVLLLISADLKSQSLSRQVIGIAGGNTTINNIKISWTAGEAIIGKVNSSDNSTSINIGFQQPTLSILPQAQESAFSINISPNPTPDLLNIKLLTPSLQELYVSLINSQGQVLLPNQKLSALSNEIDLSQFSSGIYFLKVTDQLGDDQLFKVIKSK